MLHDGSYPSRGWGLPAVYGPIHSVVFAKRLSPLPIISRYEMHWKGPDQLRQQMIGTALGQFPEL